jgi:hypothetical protein
VQGFRFESNDLYNHAAGESVIQEEFDAGDTLAAYEASYPEQFADNVELDPEFRDAASRDFVPSPGSPLIDAGAFPTRALGDGSGTTLAVEDARYFYDGFGIDGELGDLVQLDGQTETARVVSIDYDTDTLQLDRALTWTDGQGVSTFYAGTAPDLGAHEVTP